MQFFVLNSTLTSMIFSC